MNVIPRAMAFVKMLVAPQVQQVEFVNQAVAFEQIQGSVDRYAVHPGIQFLSAFQDCSGIQVSFGAVHYAEQNFALARQANATFFQGFLQPAGALMGVDAFAGGDSMCCGVHGELGIPQREPSDAGSVAKRHCT